MFTAVGEFLMRNKISTTSFNVLTPYPGTKVYEQFKEEGRLLTTDWKYYDHTTVVFTAIDVAAVIRLQYVSSAFISGHEFCCAKKCKVRL